MKISMFIKLVLLILLFCLAVCIGIYNDSYVSFRMPFNQVYVKSLAFFMIGSFLVGVVITWLYLMISVVKSKFRIISLTKKLKQAKEETDAAKKTETQDIATKVSTDKDTGIDENKDESLEEGL